MTERTKTARLYFVDALRVTLTILVVAHHAGQAYGPTGGAWPVSEPRRSALLGPFFAVNPMFFMGPFFLLAGYFATSAYDRRGAAAFLKGRLTRLGIPLLFFVLFVSAPIAYLDRGGSIVAFIGRMYQKSWTELYRHLWFVGHLLLYSVVYALWRLLVRRTRAPAEPTQTKPLRTGGVLLLHGIVLGYAVLLALVTWAVRIQHLLDRWSRLLFVLPTEYAHLPQYVSLFVIGILAYRGNWLRRFPTSSGLIWLAIGLAAALLYYLRDLRLVRFLPGVILDTGGRNRGSLVFSAWEALVCTGLCVGLPVLYRELVNRRPGRLFAAAIEAQYATYILHVPVVLGVQAALLPLELPPLLKFAIATFVGSVLSFGIGYLLKRIPGVKRVL